MASVNVTAGFKQSEIINSTQQINTMMWKVLSIRAMMYDIQRFTATPTPMQGIWLTQQAMATGVSISRIRKDWEEMNEEKGIMTKVSALWGGLSTGAKIGLGAAGIIASAGLLWAQMNYDYWTGFDDWKARQALIAKRQGLTP